MSQAAFVGGLAIRRSVDASLSGPRRISEQARLKDLEKKLETLQQDYAELNTAIFEAAQVYRRLCAPSLVRHGDFEIASEVFAVRHLPGDFFTVEETSNGLVLALGDIGGKGLAAGMWVTHLVGLIRAHTARSRAPEAIVTGVNRDIARLSSIEPLTTLFVARLDSDTRTLDYCSAGHPPALLLRRDGELELLSDGGPVLGAVPIAAFEQGSVRLNEDDVLLACSDGILESFDETDREFGKERLEAELRNARNGSAESVLFSVLGAVQDFAAPRPLTDDMTLVIVRNTSRERRIL
jgi:serine phosphatase RsbU (regulator of sigma subunit)